MINILPKFRAWDSEANIMIYSDHRTRKLYDVYYGFEMNEKGELECRWEGDFTESHVLDGGILDNIMQYTGLKDKNGVQIFEGDIVKFEDGAYSYAGTVEKDDYYFYIQGIYPETAYSFNDVADTSNHTADLVVIGNIYENPELLEK